MNLKPPRFSPLFSATTNALLATSLVFLATGCDRQPEAASPTITVPPTTMGRDLDDTVITAKVKTTLIESVDTKGFDIKVETRKGVVQLSGFIDNRAQADRAIAITRAIDGVKQVEDGMTLKDGKVSAGNEVDDAVLTTQVKSALLTDATVKSLEISVVTRKAEVQLSGFVGTQTQIDQAVFIARSVTGVQKVVNQLALKK